MPTIHLTTFIAAPIAVVFDLSRNISFHAHSMQQTNERAVAGRTEGLIELNETVTWEAKHLFKTRTLESKITAMQPYSLFEDTMVKGDFASIVHQHHFKSVANGTIMIDMFNYEVPFGFAGKCVDRLFLNGYLRRLLQQRNKLVKEYAESGRWKQFAPPQQV